MPESLHSNHRVWRNSSRRYGWIAMGFHWLVVVLVALQVWLGLTGADLPLGIERLKLLARHKSVGILILCVVLLRLAWRLYSPPPPPPPMPNWQRRAASLSHGGLYLLLFAMPLVGWASSSAAHLTVSVFGWIRLPDLLEPDRVLAQRLLTTHVVMAWTLISLLAVHVGAACWHHVWHHDNVLRRMLPFVSLQDEESQP